MRVWLVGVRCDGKVMISKLVYNRQLIVCLVVRHKSLKLPMTLSESKLQ